MLLAIFMELLYEPCDESLGTNGVKMEVYKHDKTCKDESVASVLRS